MNHYYLTNDVLLGKQNWEGKEDAFADRIVEQMDSKVLSNLPTLFEMYMAQTQPFVWLW
jgi:hypothetical protein